MSTLFESQTFDVVVIGGGVIGLSAALAMSQCHGAVAILDAGTLCVNTEHTDARVYAINQASQTLLHQLGVWNALESTRLTPFRQMHVWDAATKAHIDFDARMVGLDRLGTIIEESIIKQALLHQLSTKPVQQFPGCQVVAVDSSQTDTITVHTATQSFRAKLVIIADGANSNTRQLFDIPLTTWPYHQQAIVANIHTEILHNNTAYQVFNTEGPLAFLPLVDPNQCSIVWSTSISHAQILMNLDENDFAKQLTQSFAAKLGQCKLMGKRYQFPLHMRHTQQYSGANWLVMGDAAHTVHPLAGLGLNLGLADLATWLNLLNNNQDKTICNSTLLAAYQRQRKYEIWQTILLMESLKALFSNPLSPIKLLRGFGMRFCNQITPLKRLFIGHAG